MPFEIHKPPICILGQSVALVRSFGCSFIRSFVVLGLPLTVLDRLTDLNFLVDRSGLTGPRQTLSYYSGMLLLTLPVVPVPALDAAVV